MEDYLSTAHNSPKELLPEKRCLNDNPFMKKYLLILLLPFSLFSQEPIDLFTADSIPIVNTYHYDPKIKDAEFYFLKKDGKWRINDIVKNRPVSEVQYDSVLFISLNSAKSKDQSRSILYHYIVKKDSVWDCLFITDKKKKKIKKCYDVFEPKEYFKANPNAYYKQKLRAIYNGKIGMIDVNYNVIIPFEYDRIESLGGYVPMKGNKKGYFDGKLILDAKYDDVEKCVFSDDSKESGKLVLAKLDGKFAAFDYSGNQVLPFEYDEIIRTSAFSEKYLRYIEASSVLILRKGIRFGLASIKGKLLLPLKYDSLEIKSYSNGVSHFYASLNGKYGVVDTNDDIVVDFVYDDLASVKESQ